MPVDANGNRADIVMDPYSTIDRMNLGRLFEQYINAASRDVVLKITNDLQLVPNSKRIKEALLNIEKQEPAKIEKAWNYLLGYYSIVSPKMHVWFTDGEYKGTRLDHLLSVINNGIYLYLPPDNDVESETIIKELEKHYAPIYGPVSYIGNSGNRVTTKNNVRIGSLYIILLEKTGDDWTAVSSGKLQHFGVLAPITNADKFSQPSRNQAIRALGESEVRIYASYAGAEVTADIMDRSNNPATHKQVLYSILGADKPTVIYNTVNRQEIPLGGSKPLSLAKHLSLCSGMKFSYKPHKANLK